MKNINKIEWVRKQTFFRFLLIFVLQIFAKSDIRLPIKNQIKVILMVKIYCNLMFLYGKNSDSFLYYKPLWSIHSYIIILIYISFYWLICLNYFICITYANFIHISLLNEKESYLKKVECWVIYAVKLAYSWTINCKKII